MTAVHGWHRGEQLARRKFGVDKIASVATLYTHIRADVPEQHSAFYCSSIQFLPVCILDDAQRPWVSILASTDGEVGFVKYPKHNTLTIDAKPWPGDPFHRYLSNMNCKGRSNLIGGLGIEVSTRKRNKFAGHMTKIETNKDDIHIELEANQAVGHCPKYITLRDLLPHPKTSCFLEEDRPRLLQDDKLSQNAIDFILGADTVFLGTTYSAMEEESALYPSHLGLNHRGGRPGFIRVKPSDGRTVVLPDFKGANYLNSLGNIEATPFAAMAFVSFATGDILYLTGNARNLHGDEARAIMPLQEILTEIYVTGYTLVRDALPVRQDPAVKVEISPYSPAARFLAEEVHEGQSVQELERPTALLTRIIVHTPTLATFEWEASSPLHYKPGQSAILVFSPSFVNSHLSIEGEGDSKEEFIRTWTISNASETETPLFSLTMREKPGGKVTGALFDLARKLSAKGQAEILDNSRSLDLRATITGISGEFVLPQIKPNLPVVIGTKEIKHIFWIAGGIGITPFIAMLAALSDMTYHPLCNITLMISAREPDVMLSLVSKAINGHSFPPYLSIHIFTSDKIANLHPELKFCVHTGRIPATFFEDRKDCLTADGTEIYLCGSGPFEESVLNSLGRIGTDLGRIHREGFAY
ncbi:hypothetical protein JR316_0007416 [Psilocybe cubensis]|uniref:Uncharacterized protein n=2 Tax=Psilocybe cubensis TaxID=181762 RepID=A0ACB8H0U5_PSICU|nr:hypothetical protein JR316_0007416 [Psilocybe cubensis]KAH9480815.1 hypothetical protein JR316_0007416 [Psilocybe cubensis]